MIRIYNYTASEVLFKEVQDISLQPFDCSLPGLVAHGHLACSITLNAADSWASPLPLSKRLLVTEQLPV